MSLASLVALSSLAAETTADVELPSVKVTASPITQAERIAKDGAESVVLSREQLALLNAQDLQTALRQVPGLTISRYAPIGSYGGAQGGSVYIRGFGTARPGGEIRMYTDGVPRESGMWSHPLMDSMPIDFAATIAVQKSPHPARYSGTFGAVDVATRRSSLPGWEGEAALVCGRYGTLLSALSAGVKEGPVDAYAGGSYKRSDGYRGHNDSRIASAFGRIGLDLSETESLGFVYQKTDSRVEDPGEIIRLTPPRTDRFDLSTDLFALRFETVREGLTGFSLLAFERGAIDWYQDGLCRPPSGPAVDGNAHTEWDNFHFRNFYEWNAWRNLTLTAGLDLVHEDGGTQTRNLANGKAPFSADGALTTVSPYLGARYDVSLSKDWTLTPSIGARRYFHSQYGGEWAPDAALTLDWREKAQLFATGSRGVHYPGVYTRALAADYARSTLNAELLDYAAGGLKLIFGDSFECLATVFHTDAKDRIDKTAHGYVNAGGMRATGVEISAHVRPIDDLALFGGLTYTNPETAPVSRLPRWTASAGVTWKVCPYLTATIDGQFLDQMYAYSVRASSDAADLVRIKEGLLVNARLAVPLESITSVSGEMFVALENLADRNYEYYPGYPMEGIMWYVGCKLTF